MSDLLVSGSEREPRRLPVRLRRFAGAVLALGEVLTPEQQEDLRERLAAALLRSPTRPHPDTRHGRFGGGLAFWFDGVVDRVRDSLDSRSVPTPHRAPVLRPVTRWGAYALGTTSVRVPPERPQA